jgi:hypothetical protein
MVLGNPFLDGRVPALIAIEEKGSSPMKKSWILAAAMVIGILAAGCQRCQPWQPDYCAPYTTTYQAPVVYGTSPQQCCTPAYSGAAWSAAPSTVTTVPGSGMQSVGPVQGSGTR